MLNFHGKQRLPVPCIDISQLDRSVLYRFQNAVTGLGSLRARPDSKKRRPHELWAWYSRNWRTTQSVLTLLWPYLSAVKRHQSADVFRRYQTEVDARPGIGQPNWSSRWTADACPEGHADIYVAIGKDGLRRRRCRTCRARKVKRPYQ
jgi:hypothetical protein